MRTNKNILPFWAVRFDARLVVRELVFFGKFKFSGKRLSKLRLAAYLLLLQGISYEHVLLFLSDECLRLGVRSRDFTDAARSLI